MGDITIDYFAWVRERIGTSSETLAIAENISVRALLDILDARGGGYAEALGERDKLRFAINEDYVGESATIKPGDRLAIFPPVTGG